MLNQDELKAIEITKEELAESKYFELGVHKIKIAGAEMAKDQNGKIFAEVAVVGANGERDKVRLWLHTPATRRISIDNARRILVHNMASEADKQVVRDKFAQIKNLADFGAILSKIVGREAWLKLKESESRTYQNARGEIKPSIDRQLLGYEPKSEPKPVAVEADEFGTPHYDEDLDKEVDLSEIPF